MENEVHEKFKVELSNLLAKYRASITIEDFGRDYSRDEKIVVDFTHEDDPFYSQLILGTYFD